MICGQFEVHAGEYHICHNEADVEVKEGLWMCRAHAITHPAVFMDHDRFNDPKLQEYAETF